jgi:hypothetical protein
MLKQEELAFINAVGTMELSPVLLRVLRKAMAAAKKKKALAATTPNASASPLVHPGGAGGEARTSLDSEHPNECKRKAEELSNPDCTTEAASRRPAPGHLFEDGTEVQGTTGELTAQSSWQLGSAEGRLAYATVVAGVASLQKPSGPHKSTAHGLVPAEPTASPETAFRLMSLGDMSRPLCGMPDGATTNAQVATSSVAPTGEQQNKTPIYVTGMTDTRGFLTWLWASCQSGLSAQMKGEKLMFVPRTAEGFRATVSALRSLVGSKGVSFHTFSLPEDRCVRLLVKNLGRHMPEDVVQDELESLGICIQGILQLRLGRREQEAAKAHPLTPHFIVTVARGPEVGKMRSLTELCGLRISVETYVAPKGPL